MTIAGQIIDFYDDANREGLRKVASPKGIGAAMFEVLSPTEREGLSNDQFGLVVITKTAEVLRKFPLVDAAHIWLAGQYLDMNQDKLAAPMAVVAARHIKLASIGYPNAIPLPPFVDELADLYPEGHEGNVISEAKIPAWNLAMSKTASVSGSAAVLDDSMYGLVYQTGDGQTIRKYAMPNEVSAREAMSWFEKYASEITPEFRPRMARAIVKRAQALGIELSGFEKLPRLYKYAANGWNPNLVAHLEQRRSLLPRDEKSVEILNKLAAAIGDSEPEDFARALDAFDTRTGLRRYHGKGLEDAYSSSLGDEEKTASGWSAEVDGETVTEGDLKKAAASKSFSQFFGSAVKTAFEKDPVAIFESLPAPNKVIIAQIARGEV